MPTLSIITVVLNAKQDLQETLESIFKQTFIQFELIIIDGGSTDGTLDVIDRYKHVIKTYISEPDKGIYDAMNKGLSHASGDWITFLNAGDTYVDPNRLDRVFKGPLDNIQFIYGDMFLLDAHGKKVRYLKAEPLTKFSITKGMIACHQAMFVRRQTCPSYRMDLRYQGDLDWVMSILHQLSPDNIRYIAHDIVYFKSGGFSDQTIFKQLQEHLYLIVSRYGLMTLFLVIPRLCRRYLGKWLRRTLQIETFRFWITH